MAYQVAKIADQTRWDAFVEAHPDGHVLQLADWGHLKTAFGWSAEQVAVADNSGGIVAGAQVLYRRLPLRLGQMAYIPAGPLFCEDEAANARLWQAIDGAAHKRRTVFLKVEPCNWYCPRPDLPDRLERAGLRLSPQTVQPPRTVILDITPDEETILKQMNQSTRYKAKLGPKKEVGVREGTRADIASFNRLMAVTGERDAFGVHAPAYYQMVFDRFAPGGHCALLLASYAGQDLAGVMVLRCGQNAYYFYGASSNIERNRMPTYIVQWEGIRWARRQGAANYDLWGIPDAEEATLEREFETRRDGLWGVYGFKRGFGGRIVRSVGAWDKPYNALLYAAYRWVLRRRESR
jgi:peptidoglycan pentaglycine glycine transferase (the first glycine)